METAEKKSYRMTNQDPDNPDQQMIHQCMTHKRRMLNPIIDWSTEEVWEFIHEYNVPYCKLYDEGYKRLGCIGCPMGSVESRYRAFERYPKYKQAYIRAFDRMIDVRNGGGIDRTCRQERKNCEGISTEIHELECDGLVQVVHEWETSDEVMKWWIK